MSPVTTSLLQPRPSGLLPFVMGSVLLHVVAAFVWLALAWVFAGPAISFEQEPIKASLVRLGKPRDEKLLPRKEEEPPPPPKVEAEPVKVPAPAPAETAVKIPSKDAKPDKPTADKKDGAKDAKKSLFDAFNKTARAGKVEEVEGAADGDPNGDSAKQEGERYFGLLKSVVQRNYDVSDTIPENERRTLKADVTLWIGLNGEVINVKLTHGSGNEQFDAAVMAAVKKASPFAPPPDHLRDTLKKQGVGFVFRALN